MNDLTRYSCQIMLPGFDKQAQEKLSASSVLVVGAGGLGCPALQYLASTGVGTIGIADPDLVSISNLHRQILYTPADEGKRKAIVARERLQGQNPDILFEVYDVAVTADNVLELFEQYDIIVDCTDNFDTRYLLNDAAVLSGKPLVYGAIYQYEGQVAVWNVNNSPNYRDLYPDVNAAAVPNCAEGGVLPTIAGMIGVVQANEVIKYLTGVGDLLAGKLMVIDVQTMQSRIMKTGSVTQTTITALPEQAILPEIDINELVDDHLLIDVRSYEERAEYNIGGKHIPLSDLSSADIQTSKAVVCYCASGKRSAEAVRLLSKKYPDGIFYSLKGGITKKSSL